MSKDWDVIFSEYMRQNGVIVSRDYLNREKITMKLIRILFNESDLVNEVINKVGTDCNEYERSFWTRLKQIDPNDYKKRLKLMSLGWFLRPYSGPNWFMAPYATVLATEFGVLSNEFEGKDRFKLLRKIGDLFT